MEDSQLSQTIMLCVGLVLLAAALLIARRMKQKPKPPQLVLGAVELVFAGPARPTGIFKAESAADILDFHHHLEVPVNFLALLGVSHTLSV